MLELPHTVVGAAIGTKIPNPLVAIPLALVSHFLLDLIPHWNPSLYTETKKFGQPTRQSTKMVAIDALTSLAVGLFVASRAWPDIYRFICITLACFAAVAPDVAEAPYFFFGIRPQFLGRWIEFQHNLQGRASKIPGLLIQIFILIIALIVSLTN